MNDFQIKDLPEIFADVEPVPQADGPTAVCRIDYPPLFVQAYDYFRGVMRRNEHSARALRLTELCLEQNPANYTVWHYRRLCLYTLPDDDWTTHIPYDLALAARLGGENPKNYQIWYHRRAILTEFAKQKGDVAFREAFATGELAYIATVLQADGKNYHAWSYRQWLLLQTVKDNNNDGNENELWQSELAYTDELIQQDIRNNSAWNQRWFVTHRGCGKELSIKDACAEADYALEKATMDPFNESPFSYFLAIAKEVAKTNDAKFKTEFLPPYGDKLQAVMPDDTPNDDNNNSVSSYLLAARVEWLAYQGDAESLAMASALLDRLAEHVDPIRRKYWALRKLQLPLVV